MMRFLLFLLLFLGSFSIHSYADVSSKPPMKDITISATRQLYEESLKAVEKGDWEEALQKLQHLNERYPNNPYSIEARLLMAVIYIKSKNPAPEKAKAILTEVAKEHPRKFEAFLQQLKEIEKQGKAP